MCISLIVASWFVMMPLAMQERMVRSIEASGLQPVIDRTFSIDETAKAYAHLESATHFGKVVIEI